MYSQLCIQHLNCPFVAVCSQHACVKPGRIICLSSDIETADFLNCCTDTQTVSYCPFSSASTTLVKTISTLIDTEHHSHVMEDTRTAIYTITIIVNHSHTCSRFPAPTSFPDLNTDSTLMISGHSSTWVHLRDFRSHTLIAPSSAQLAIKPHGKATTERIQPANKCAIYKIKGKNN